MLPGSMRNSNVPLHNIHSCMEKSTMNIAHIHRCGRIHHMRNAVHPPSCRSLSTFMPPATSKATTAMKIPMSRNTLTHASLRLRSITSRSPAIIRHNPITSKAANRKDIKEAIRCPNRWPLCQGME